MKQIDEKDLNRAWDIVGWYTLAALVKGAVPIPAMSIAIVANNGFMIGHVSSALSEDVSWENIVASLGVSGALNTCGRAVFIELAKAVSWGTGSPWAAIALSCFGSATAGVQTLIIGSLAIEIAKKGGRRLTAKEADAVIAMANANYKSFVASMKNRDLPDPSGV